MIVNLKSNLTLVEFEEDFESNITACLGCETIVTFGDLWYSEYCCSGCAK